MGYTHYWTMTTKEIPQELWDKFIADFNKVLPNFVNHLDQETEQKLQRNNEILFFNGIGDLAHETFVMERVSNQRNFYDDEDPKGYFSFCKTAYKPYDLAVCSAIIIAKRHFDKLIDVSTDGGNKDWIKAKNLCHKILGYGNLDFSRDSNSNRSESYGKLLDLPQDLSSLELTQVNRKSVERLREYPVQKNESKKENKIPITLKELTA